MTARRPGVDLADRIDSAQRAVLISVAPVSALLFWRAGTNSFHLPKITAVTVMALTVVALTAASFVFGQRRKLSLHPVLISGGLVVGAGVVATVLARSPVVSFFGGSTHRAGLAAYAVYFVLMVAVARYLDETTAWAAIRTFVMGGLVVAFYGAAQSFGVDPFDWHTPVAPIFSTMGNSNFLAAHAAMTTPLAAGLLLRPDAGRLDRAFAFVAGAACLAVAFRSKSAQGLPIASLGLVVAALPFTPRLVREVQRRAGGLRRWQRLAVVLVSVVLLAGASLRVAPILRSEFGSGLETRRGYWSAAAAVVKESPLIGVGLDDFGTYYFSRRPAHTAFNPDIAEDPHNVFLSMFVGGGALLGAAYLAFVGASAATLATTWRRRLSLERRVLLSAVSGSWVAYQAQSLIGIDVPALAVGHWVVTGLVVVVAAAVRSGEVPPVPTRHGKRGHPRPQRLTLTGVGALAVIASLYLVACWWAVRPLRADAAAAAAESHNRAGRSARALSEASEAIRLAPWESRYWFAYAAALEGTGERRAAQAAASRAAELEPGSPRLALLAARLAERAGDHRAATRWYAEALQREPNAPSILREVATYELRSGRPAAAASIARRAVRQWPDNPDLLLALARSEAALGNSRAATDAYAALAAIAPSHAGATEAREYIGSY